ncbi:MAG: Fe-S protein assembly co-chaperone HscB [Phycisphaerae bacterium]
MAAETPTLPTKCLNCHADLKTPVVCTGCHTLFPIPAEVDYFTLLNLPRGYRLDDEKLDRHFLAITRSVHPDFFGAASDQMQQLSIKLSAELNEAARVLRDPVLRASYMLERAGGPSATQFRDVPQEVLTEAMTWREELEEAGDDQGALSGIRDQVAQKRAAILEQVAARADALDSADDAQKQELRRLLNSIKYYDNLLADLPVA